MQRVVSNKRWTVWAVALVVALVIAGVIATSAAGLLLPRLAEAQNSPGQEVAVWLEFSWIRQGRVGIVRVTGNAITEVRAIFQDRLIHFYPDARGYVGLLSAHMGLDVGDYPLQVWVNFSDGSAQRIDEEVEVTFGEFGRADLLLPEALAGLIEPTVEEAEMTRLFNILDRFTPERYWSTAGFMTPTDGPLIGYFGTWRLYNGTYWSRHTGLDVTMAYGTPVIAAANGRVILAEELDIRGGYVLIDHGWGVYSGYAHLSEALVVPGQYVRQGDVIGRSGDNGRSTGPHLHWEMAVSGAWTDPDDFMGLPVFEGAGADDGG